MLPVKKQELFPGTGGGADGISNANYLIRVFKKRTGKTVGEYVVELRMSTAARQLLISDKPISTIAYEVGYENPGYFTRIFRSYFGTSPYEYRKNARI